MIKVSLLTLAIGAAFHSADSRAAVSTYFSDSNAVNYCQAFTPGVTNTIRNRVIGAQNIGTATIAVACNYATTHNTNDMTDQNLAVIAQVFSNGSTSPVSISCTLLTGTPGFNFGDAYSVTKTLNLAPGAADFIEFSGTDNPTPSATFNNGIVGVNCNLPSQVYMTDVELVWQAEDGIGT
jgi:hypothetical protein